MEMVLVLDCHGHCPPPGSVGWTDSRPVYCTWLSSSLSVISHCCFHTWFPIRHNTHTKILQVMIFLLHRGWLVLGGCHLWMWRLRLPSVQPISLFSLQSHFQQSLREFVSLYLQRQGLCPKIHLFLTLIGHLLKEYHSSNVIFQPKIKFVQSLIDYWSSLHL